MNRPAWTDGERRSAAPPAATDLPAHPSPPAGAVTPVAAAFDALAPRYDERFTAHPAGRLVRAAVWRVTDARFRAGDRILDLGCGTGADAVHLAERGCRVIAVDVSERMVARTRGAADRAGGGIGARVRTAMVDFGVGAGLAAVDALAFADGPGRVGPAGGSFDGALSDFGALNCVGDLASLGAALAERVRPGGHFVAVVMARFCAWELAAGLARGDVRRATRRWSGRSTADLGTGPWPVWYRSPRAIARGLGPSWSLECVVPIGAVVPPTWAVTAGGRFDRPWLWRFWAALEAAARRMPSAGAWADHVLLDLVRRPPPGADR